MDKCNNKNKVERTIDYRIRHKISKKIELILAKNKTNN